MEKNRPVDVSYAQYQADLLEELSSRPKPETDLIKKLSEAGLKLIFSQQIDDEGIRNAPVFSEDQLTPQRRGSGTGRLSTQVGTVTRVDRSSVGKPSTTKRYTVTGAYEMNGSSEVWAIIPEELFNRL